jgi:hypothetical protein
MKKLLLPLLIFAGTAQAQSTLTETVAVGWTYTQGSDAATSFNVYGCSGAGCTPAKLNTTAIPTTTLAYSIPNVPVGVPYTVWVAAVAASGSLSTPAIGTLGAPSAPGGLTLTPTINISAAGPINITLAPATVAGAQ